MEFNETPTQTALRDQIREFCSIHCTDDVAAEHDRCDSYPKTLHDALAKAGILGHCLPSAYGGNDGDVVDLCILNEELSQHSTVATNILFVSDVVGTLLASIGSDMQKELYIPAICNGSKRFAFALTEPGAGSDAGGIQMFAHKNDNGSYRINGSKLYTTGAADADYILTAVKTASDAKPSRSISLFIVPTDTSGMTITKLEKLAGNNIASCKVEYKDVEVSSELLIGMEHQGWSGLMIGGGLERLSVAACCLGAARATFDEVTEFVKQRQQFGQNISQFQAVQHQIADMAIRIEAMHWLIYSAAYKTARGQAAIQNISMAKVFATEVTQEIVTMGMRLLGGKAYFMDSPMQRRLRETYLAFYAGGTMEIQRNVIAKCLGL